MSTRADEFVLQPPWSPIQQQCYESSSGSSCPLQLSCHQSHGLSHVSSSTENLKSLPRISRQLKAFCQRDTGYRSTRGRLSALLFVPDILETDCVQHCSSLLSQTPIVFVFLPAEYNNYTIADHAWNLHGPDLGDYPFHYSWGSSGNESARELQSYAQNAWSVLCFVIVVSPSKQSIGVGTKRVTSWKTKPMVATPVAKAKEWQNWWRMLRDFGEVHKILTSLFDPTVVGSVTISLSRCSRKILVAVI
jgi:hypothetical protein